MVDPLRIANTVVPVHVVAWTRSAMKLIRCNQSLAEPFLRSWLRSGHVLGDLNEGIVSDFLLSKNMIDRDTWESHRRMSIVKMYFGTNPRYANDIAACAKACKVSVGFATRAVQDNKA